MAPAERFEATGDPTPGPSGDQESDDSETPAEEIEADDGSDASDNGSSSDSDDSEAGGDDGDNGAEDVLANAYKEKPKAPPVLRPPGAPTDLQFRPSANEIAVGTIDGDIVLYSFTDESAELKRTYEVHEDATRRVCFSEDGRMLFSISKNGDLAAVDVETGEIEDLIEEIYEDGAHALQPVNRHVCVTGDADGFLKVFDFRSGKCVMEQQVHSDLITSIVVFPDQKTVVASSADGTISSYNVKAKRFEVQSEEYKEDMTAMALTRSATKLLVTTNKGMMYVFDHGAYGLHSATFGRPMKSGINALVAVGDKMVIAGNEDGVLRAVHVFPNRILGVVGQHEDAIDRIDVSSDGDFLASTDNEVVRFWNVSYLKSVKISDKEKGDNKAALSKNLPSSRLQDARNFFADMDE